ncbi:hypothetical protein E8E01_22950 [Methylorubrum populi]|uniref:hypothetical protein n=1 Tax=Methylorubrum TaxID=2282523 RepID=UPI00114FAD0E|nr:hypothetical protein [Methylorubrum populi]QDI83790.1 hypothetical protein E8E01_22950 [Methylorubrum populi]
MSVAIHPSETRRTEGQAPSRLRLPVLVGAAGGSVALLAFAVGAFSFFSDLADPRSRPVRIAPVASQWPDLKDGVPALAPSSAGPPNETRRETRQASLPAAEPAISAAMPAALPAAQVQVAAPESPPPAPLPIEPAATVPAAARTAATVTPTKVAVPLPPSRSETVRAKTEQPAQFVSLPAPKARPEPARTEAKAEIKSRPEAKAEAVKETAKEPTKETAKKAEVAKIEPARKPAPVARNRAAEPRPTQTASAQAPAAPAREAADEPELLGVKIPGGRQIREGWDAAVSGLLGGKSGGE